MSVTPDKALTTDQRKDSTTFSLVNQVTTCRSMSQGVTYRNMDNSEAGVSLKSIACLSDGS